MSSRGNDAQPLLPTNTNAPNRKSCCRRVCCAFAYLLSILLTIALTVGVTLLVQYLQEQLEMQEKTQPKEPEKIILLWNQQTSALSDLPTTIFQHKLNNCRWHKHSCLVTNDRHLLSVADSVFFTSPRNVADMPPKRQENQNYVQCYGDDWHDFFNVRVSCDNYAYTKASITARTGAVITLPNYAYDVNSYTWQKPWGLINQDLSKLALKKWDAVLLKEQPCKASTHIGELVNELRKHLTFSSHGTCNETIQLEDSKGDYLANYDVKLTQLAEPIEDYKFVLLPENSITSNFYEVLRNGAVPVVFTSENVTLYAPPKSYISANDFKTMRELADHLNYLSRTPSEYLRYFWWHNEYELFDVDYARSEFCDICNRMYSSEYSSAGIALGKLESPSLRLIMQLTIAFTLTLTYHWL